MSYRWLKIVLITMASLVLYTSPQAAACRLDIGSAAPRLIGTDVAGNTQNLSDYAGQWVFVDFWATWCRPCMKKLPGVVSLHEEMGSRSDFAVLSISLDEAAKLNQVHDVQSKYGISFPVVFDGNGWYSENARNWCVESIPATFLVDPQGRVVARDVSPDTVSAFINKAGVYESPPIQLSCTERIQSDSSSTGRGDRQDFLIEVGFLGSSPEVSRYRLNVAYAHRDAGGTLVEHRMRYQIAVNLLPPGIKPPYHVSITGLDIDRSDYSWLAYEPYIGTPAAPGAGGGNVAVTVDVPARVYRFVQPLPRDCVMVAYSMDFYNTAIGEFVGNGVRRMESAY